MQPALSSRPGPPFDAAGSRQRRRWALSALLAATAPTLLAYNPPPSPTMLNQLLALALWGVFVALHPAGTGPDRARPRGLGVRGVLAATALLAVATVASWAWRALPLAHALSALGLLAAAAALVAAAAGLSGRPAQAAFEAFCTGWVAAALLGTAVGLVQVFAPSLSDGTWIAATTIEGRAVGNLRQPNHLSSVLLWGGVAVVALLGLGRLSVRTATVLLSLTVGAVVLTASRTGLLSVGLLALWGLLDRRLPRAARVLLLATPLLYGLAWAAMAQWATWSGHAFGGAQRLAETDISGSRFGIWRDTLTLIAQQPWTGVGMGNFNLAWTLTPLPQRPTAFFDHAHNLPLQLLAELGVPLGLLVLALLVVPLAAAGWQAFGPQRTAAAGGEAAGRGGEAADASLPQRAALVMVAMIGLHSLLEYPLWYAHFLLPAAWALGMAVRRSDASRPTTATAPGALSSSPTGATPVPIPVAGVPVAAVSRLPWRPIDAVAAAWPAIAGGAMVMGACLAALDYATVVDIYTVRDGAGPLEARIERGQRSVLSAHHADYAAVTTPLPDQPTPAAHDFDRVAHHLLDTRLMIAWAEALQREGRGDAARHLAARLREFRKADAEAFFAPCDRGPGEARPPSTAAGSSPASTAPPLRGASVPPAVAAASAPAFPCTAPAAPVPWTAFLPSR